MTNTFLPVNGISNLTVLYGFDNGITTNPTLNTLFSRKREKKRLTISSNNQNTFNVIYNSNQEIDVYLNGLLLDEETAYSFSNGDTLTLDSSLSSSISTDDVLYVVLY
ncbi:hypothetical protein M2305_003250 [Gluconobacter cerinus]|uniref:hypothetical protein n=1 Tax=Gluconobacter cerinus TaxID=38307 RepID=UPI002227830E|nr:hypothetical protein [Gluconobacter cerinus]MCW2267231.1 hypothetical protein [Gluconobacter cerinus]